jgi:uncharacterized cupin superfamily protein
MPEAKLVDIGSGLAADGDGWYVVNLRDAAWFHNAAFGSSALFQEPSRAPQLGVNIGVLEPGKPNCLYHEESEQEAFLVLAGECVLVVDGEERTLRAWDFFHCPPGTRHVFVGAGDEPCAVVFIGARREEGTVLYPRDEVAARHGASAAEDATDPSVAYAGFPDYEPAPSPPGMPWNS